ncbi:MAG: formylglycine-generating enzyme family protein, partial [Anaerolineales bacterium]|nr:formylglycine-generating enzyme family protein [Anaerolineales bacterium]
QQSSVISSQSSVSSGQSSVVGAAPSPTSNQQSAISNQQSDDAATIDQGVTMDTEATLLQEEQAAQGRPVPGMSPLPPASPPKKAHEKRRPSHPERRIWWLWPAWILATGVGMGLAGGIGYWLLSGSGGIFARLVAGLLGGALLGLAQWLVVRRHLSSSGWWIVLTAGAFSLCWWGSVWSVWWWILIGGMLGAAQWFLLRRAHARALWWVPVCAAGHAAAWLILTILGGLSYDGISVVIWSLAGGLFGLINGWLLVLLLRGGQKSQPAGRTAGQALAGAGAGGLLLGGALFLLLTGIRPGSPQQILVRERDGMEMVYVPAGEFLMGSPAGVGWSDERPQHVVYLDAFWIDRTEVTNAMYARFLNERGNQEEGGVTWLDEGYARVHQSGGRWAADAGYEEHPVVAVSWFGAAAYCEWAGARLPTEAEWEKAARGTDGRTYPWGDAAPTCSLLNFWPSASDCVVGTSAVGSYPAGASPYGALDMAGNVWEWVADWYDENYYANSPSRNPQGPSSGSAHVLRGGSWYDFVNSVRPAYRYGNGPGYRYVSLFGFRCVLSK